jgi:hypothetical protein
MHPTGSHVRAPSCGIARAVDPWWILQLGHEGSMAYPVQVRASARVATWLRVRGASVARMTDPVSWLQIAQGWDVVTTDGVSVGAVAQVEGDKQGDIFDGLAVQSSERAQILYVPGEQVGAIYPGKVTLKIPSTETGSLVPFQAPPSETTWRPGTPPLTTRMSNWLRGKR